MGEVEARILAKVVEYCKYHHLSERSTDEVERWEKDFVNVDKSTLFQLILVRHWLFDPLFSTYGVAPLAC